MGLEKGEDLRSRFRIGADTTLILKLLHQNVTPRVGRQDRVGTERLRRTQAGIDNPTDTQAPDSIRARLDFCRPANSSPNTVDEDLTPQAVRAKSSPIQEEVFEDAIVALQLTVVVEAFVELACRPIRKGNNQIVPRPEMPIDARHLHTEALRNIRHRETVDAPTRRQLPRRLENLLRTQCPARQTARVALCSPSRLSDALDGIASVLKILNQAELVVFGISHHDDDTFIVVVPLTGEPPS